MNKEDLTEETETLIDMLGEKDAIKFVEVFGSKRITLSTDNRAWEICLRLFGIDKTLKLQTYIGPVYYYVPKKLIKTVRNLKIKQDKKLGISMDGICQKYGISRPTYFRILT